MEIRKVVGSGRNNTRRGRPKNQKSFFLKKRKKKKKKGRRNRGSVKGKKIQTHHGARQIRGFNPKLPVLSGNPCTIAVTVPVCFRSSFVLTCLSRLRPPSQSMVSFLKKQSFDKELIPYTHLPLGRQSPSNQLARNFWSSRATARSLPLALD